MGHVSRDLHYNFHPCGRMFYPNDSNTKKFFCSVSHIMFMTYCSRPPALSTLALGKMPAFSSDLNVSIQPSYVLSTRDQPNFLAFSVELMVNQLLPVAHMKKPQVPQSMASGFPPYFFTIFSHTGRLSLAHSTMSTSLSSLSDLSFVFSNCGSGTCTLWSTLDHLSSLVC